MGFVNNDNKELKNIKTLGIDQSFTHTGLVVTCRDGEIIDAKGVTTSNKVSTEERIEHIVEEIVSFIKKHSIRQVVIEGLAFGVRAASLTNLSGLQHVILHEIRKLKIPYEIVPPRTLKKNVTGSGKAEKHDMQGKVDIADQMTLCELSGVKLTAKKFEDLIDAYWLSRHMSM